MYYRKAVELIIKLEGLKKTAYDDTENLRTVGLGFNMEALGARQCWEDLNIKEDFVKVFSKEIKISRDTASLLFESIWTNCVSSAIRRCKELELDYNKLPDFHQFILADIVYNTGNLRKWKQVLIKTEPTEILYEARRNPKEIMDSRVAKIGYYFGLIKSLEEAHNIGLVYAKYLE